MLHILQFAIWLKKKTFFLFFVVWSYFGTNSEPFYMNNYILEPAPGTTNVWSHLFFYGTNFVFFGSDGNHLTTLAHYSAKGLWRILLKSKNSLLNTVFRHGFLKRFSRKLFFKQFSPQHFIVLWWYLLSADTIIDNRGR